MKIFLLTSMLLLLWAISCDKDKETSGLTIVGGSVCGWCAGKDSVILSEYDIQYRNMKSCDRHAYSKITDMDKAEWDKITRMINYEKFSDIHLNSCNICVDGCDNWITIRNESYSHTIRYGYGDSAVLQAIRPLIEKIDSIRQDFRKQIEI
jgi:hypothetical protein